jgi:type IV secretion system protein TrbE
VISHQPEEGSGLVDAERRAQFEEEGAHFESAYFLTFLFLPPAEEAARAEALLYEGRVRDEGSDVHEILKGCCSLLRASFPKLNGSRTPRR